MLEGGIRKSGDTVRVTAQLINVADGYHLWSQTYDRELTDIFRIQEEIARAVAGALGAISVSSTTGANMDGPMSAGLSVTMTSPAASDAREQEQAQRSS